MAKGCVIKKAEENPPIVGGESIEANVYVVYVVCLPSFGCPEDLFEVLKIHMIPCVDPNLGVSS